MNPDFGYKHLTGLAWLLCLIAIVMTVLLVIRKKKGFGENLTELLFATPATLCGLGRLLKAFV